MKKVAVLGDGAWGTAVAMLLADNGHEVILWCYNQDVARAMTNQGRNTVYFPDFALDTARIHATTDIEHALEHAECIFEAIPVKYMRSVLTSVRIKNQQDKVWVVLSKGIEQDTLLLPSQIIHDVFAEAVHTAVISGPSFAKDVANKQPTVVALAAKDRNVATRIQQLVSNNYFRLRANDDLIGTQIGGALKNCLALAIGILDGAGYTDNTKAIVLTRGLHEMANIACALGGTSETVYDVSGLGDAVLTALGQHSKNLALGRRLGSGEALQKVGEETLPEGINTVVSVHQLIQKYKIDMPLLTAVHDVVIQGKPVQHLIDVLMHTGTF